MYIGLQKLALRRKVDDLSTLRARYDCVHLLNTAGRISHADRDGLRALGLDDSAKAVGRAWWAFWPWQANRIFKAQFRKALEGQQSRFKLRRDMNGRETIWSITLRPVAGVQNTPTSILVLANIDNSPS